MSPTPTLTPEQEAIVAHPPEPLRVAAGAGTGKTTTMVARLASAVAAGIEPEEALGITFTNKAAEELADRLRSELHALAVDGREVEVTTYHGFAHRLLHEFGGFAGLDTGLEVIGPGYVRQLLHEAVGAGTYRHLDLTKLAVHVDDAATLGAQLAGNLLEPEDLIAAAPGEGDDATWGARIELAGALATYRDCKRRLGVVDYGDLIAMAHHLVTAVPEVARRVRSRYRMVVLDEYQDTDPAQRDLLLAIFGDGFPVTAVGDEDQTIYEWRGASLDNFRSFPRHFATAGGPAPTLPLSLNRRSGPHILHLADTIRTELHGAPPRHPLRPAPGADDQVVCGWFRTSHDEATWIAGELRRLHDEEQVPWSEMAVVFRKNRQMALVRDALHDAEIPFEVASLGGLLGVPEVADVHAWLRILHDPADSVALARILLGSRYRLGLGDLAPLARHARAASPNRDDPLGFPLLEAVDRLDETAGLSDTARRRLAEFRDLYRRLLVDAQATTLVDLIQRIVDGIDGWAEIEAMPEVAALSARLNLYRFLDLAEDWSPLAGRPSLDGFLSYLEALVAENAGDELSTARVSQGEAVTLVTVHRAKGLEWDTVVLPALAEGTFPSSSQRYDDPLRSPRWLPHELRLDAATATPLPGPGKERDAALRERHLAQERRTAYVAVTRARTRLLLSGAYWYEGNKTPKRPGEIITSARELPGTDVGSWVDEPGDRPTDHPVPAEAPDPHFPGGWRDALRRVLAEPHAPRMGADDGQVTRALEDLQLVLDAMPDPLPPVPSSAAPATSVTGLMTLAGCPRRFYWSEVDRLPRRPSPSLARGSEVHRRIQLHNLGVLSLDPEPPLERTEGQRGAGGASPPVGDPYQAFLGSRFAAERPILVEAPIDIDITGVRVRGRIDAVYSSRPGAWEIVDYKSGRPPENGDTAAVQLEAYAVAAADGAVAPERPDEIRVTFAYLGGETVEERSVVADEEWLASARHRLEALAEQAKGPDYPATPSPACHRCDFLAFCEPGAAFARSARDRSVNADEVLPCST